MSHCIVSLKIAGRFENRDGIDWEPVCSKNLSLNNDNSSSELRNSTGKYSYFKKFISV